MYCILNLTPQMRIRLQTFLKVAPFFGFSVQIKNSVRKVPIHLNSRAYTLTIGNSLK
jgi:hypothetical protein